MIPDVGDVQGLAHKIWASFELPWWMSMAHKVDNYYLAPQVPNCICQKDFLLLPDLRFPCWDLQEEQRKKTMAYAKALQCWVKRANLPIPGQPCLLGGLSWNCARWWNSMFLFPMMLSLAVWPYRRGFFGSQTPISKVSLDTLPTSTNMPCKEVPMEEVASIGGPLEEPITTWEPHESKLGWRLPQTNSPVGRKCYIPLSWLLPWGKSHWLLVNVSKGTTARVLRQGELNTKGQKSGCKQDKKKEIHPHLGLWNHCTWWPWPWALRK